MPLRLLFPPSPCSQFFSHPRHSTLFTLALYTGCVGGMECRRDPHLSCAPHTYQVRVWWESPVTLRCVPWASWIIVYVAAHRCLCLIWMQLWTLRATASSLIFMADWAEENLHIQQKTWTKYVRSFRRGFSNFVGTTWTGIRRELEFSINKSHWRVCVYIYWFQACCGFCKPILHPLEWINNKHFPSQTLSLFGMQTRKVTFRLTRTRSLLVDFLPPVFSAQARLMV